MTGDHNSALPARSLGKQSDERLAALARTNTAAFGELYERYLTDILRFCYRRVGSVQSAEDLTASVFERALSRINTFHGGSFRAWLFSIAHNAVTDHYRRHRPTVPWRAELGGTDDSPSPEDHVLAVERRTRIRSLLDHLTDDQRRVVELRLSGLTGREIADALGKSQDAVKMLQFRALERIRTHIASESDDAETSDA